MKKTLEEKNGTIAALFLFQYSLLIPLMRYISPAVLVAFTGIILMIAAFFVNKSVVVNLKAAAVIVALLALMLFKVLIDETELVVILNFLLISIPPLIVSVVWCVSLPLVIGFCSDFAQSRAFALHAGSVWPLNTSIPSRYCGSQRRIIGQKGCA